MLPQNIAKAHNAYVSRCTDILPGANALNHREIEIKLSLVF